MSPRILATSPERRTVLVVRILTQPESETDSTSKRIKGMLFNAFNSVASQMRLCSNNQILLEPATVEPVQTAVVNLVDDPANRTQWVLAAHEQFPPTMAAILSTPIHQTAGKGAAAYEHQRDFWRLEKHFARSV